MNVKILAASIAVLAMHSGSALALPASTPLSSYNIVLNVAGASAQDNNIENLLTDTSTGNALCGSGITTFLSPGGSRNYTAVSCLLGPKAGALNGKTLLYRKRSAGGSGQGVNPLIQGASGENQFLDVTASCSGGSSVVNETVTCTSQVLETADLHLGVSDVEPALFKGVNTPEGSQPVTSVTGIQVEPAAALIFGIPVNIHMYNALQAAQKAAGIIPSSCPAITSGGAGVAGNPEISEECMPSLSKAQVATILAGHAFDAADLKFNGVPLTTFGSSVSTTQLQICRRVNGSGTQAQANLTFLGAECVAGAFLPATAALSGPPGNSGIGPGIHENSGSSDVSRCLADFQNGTNNSGKNALSGAKTAYAIGIQSTEKLDPSFQFVKIDGVAPTLENTAAGKYLNWVEPTFQYRNLVLNTPQRAIINEIISGAATANVLGALNLSKYVHKFGNAGYLAVSQNANSGTYDPVLDVNNPVIAYTHVNGKLNNCISPVVNPAFGATVPVEP